MDRVERSGKPAILIVEAEGEWSRTATQLRDRYGRSYAITTVSTAERARSELDRFAYGGDDLALVLTERGGGNTAVLEAAIGLHPRARRGLLLEWNESRTHREEIAAAFAGRQAECFVTKPTGGPDERFHRSITELLDEWWRIHGSPVSGVQIVGPTRSPRIYEICDTLQRHDFPYTFHPVGSDTATAVLQQCGTTGDKFPVIVLR